MKLFTLICCSLGLLSGAAFCSQLPKESSSSTKKIDRAWLDAELNKMQTKLAHYKNIPNKPTVGSEVIAGVGALFESLMKRGDLLNQLPDLLNIAGANDLLTDQELEGLKPFSNNQLNTDPTQKDLPLIALQNELAGLENEGSGIMQSIKKPRYRTK